jgi:hypothetical protein
VTYSPTTSAVGGFCVMTGDYLFRSPALDQFVIITDESETRMDPIHWSNFKDICDTKRTLLPTPGLEPAAVTTEAFGMPLPMLPCIRNRN